MNVPSFQFLLFALIGAVVFHLLPWRAWRQVVMLAVNLGFFASFDPHHPLAYIPFAAFLLLGYVGLSRDANRAIGWLVVCSILVMFFWLKKYTFIPGPLFLSHPYVTIGLSYVFFRVLHLAIDAHQGDLPERPGLLSYLNYTLNFTSLVAGPIQRYDNYRITAEAPRPINAISLAQSAERIICGLFKVFVVSALLSTVKQNLIDELTITQPFEERILIGMGLIGIYPLYLYFNFSGYTDFVIGVARWFGLVLPENFDRPFQSTNFIEFWSRWHITLSNWLKTYVYQPLMLRLMGRFPSRSSEPAIVVLALFVTFFLVGAWHGQTTTFLFFGVLQGSGVAVNRLFQFSMTKRLGKPALSRAWCQFALPRLDPRAYLHMVRLHATVVLVRLGPDPHLHECAGCERCSTRPLAVVRDLDTGPGGLGRDQQCRRLHDLVRRVDCVLPLYEDDVEYSSSGRHRGGRCAVQCAGTADRVQELLSFCRQLEQDAFARAHLSGSSF